MAYLNPKNIALIVLALPVAAVGGLYLWQRSTLKEKEIVITRQSADILALNKERQDLQGQIEDYKTNLVAAKKAQAAQQRIQATTAGLKTEIIEIKTEVILEASDEKILSDITYYFNSRGLRRDAGQTGNNGAETVAKILPQTGAPGPDRSHRWTVKQIVANYLDLIDYTLKLERTVECYENDQKPIPEDKP